MWERSFKQVSISSKSKSKVCGVWTRTLLSFLCLKIYFLLLIYMILQVGLHPNFFIYDLWDLSWISLIFMIISPSCFLNWEFIPWAVYYHYVLMISKQFKSSSMSWIFLLWIDDFWMIWDKCHELCLSMRNSTIECILICEIERQEWVLWCFHEVFDIWNDLINKCTWYWESLCWVESS